MFKSLLAAVAALAIAMPAMADSWDSAKNVDRAMTTALETYRARGTTGLVDESANCYAGLDTTMRNRNMGRDVEYCIAYEYSSAVIDREVSKTMKFPPTPALEFSAVMMRAMAVLERAKIIRLPEEFDAYLVPRLKRVADELPRKM